MKNEWTTKPEEIKILPEIKKLWFEIDGSVPVKRKYKTVFDFKNEKEQELIRGLIGLGSNLNREFDNVYLHVTDSKKHKCVFEEVLQHKQNINELWELLNIRLINKPDYNCCICGTKMQGARHIKGCGWEGLRSGGNNWTTCYNHSYVEDKGEFCHDIRSMLIRYLKILRRKIDRLEKKNVCVLCNEKFSTTRKDTKFCSIKCRVTNHRLNNPPLNNQTK